MLARAYLCWFNKLLWLLFVKNILREVLQIKIQAEIIFRLLVNGDIRQEWSRTHREEVHFVCLDLDVWFQSPEPVVHWYFLQLHFPPTLP